MKNEKQVLEVIQSGEAHWVGDGFPVKSLFAQHSFSARISPFLMLDYAPPAQFPPSDQARGVDSHPHKGFETVTIVYQGALEHRDSTGSHGVIGPGDVQWMTAAAGIVHEEKHERNWSKRGGVLQMVQLWVNLPARFKSSPSRYQTLLRDQIPVVQLPDGAGTVRVIAGQFLETQGAAKTFTPINVYDMKLRAGHETSLDLPAGFNTAVVVLEGEVRFNGSHPAKEVALALFDPNGRQVRIEARQDAAILVLNGEPINEPIAAYGPFVMNTREEVIQAADDFQSGKMGQLA